MKSFLSKMVRIICGMFACVMTVYGTGGAAEVRLWQYLWVYGHSDCVGYAVSTIRWDGAAFQLLQQEVVPAFPG